MLDLASCKQAESEAQHSQDLQSELTRRSEASERRKVELSSVIRLRREQITELEKERVEFLKAKEELTKRSDTTAR